MKSEKLEIIVLNGSLAERRFALGDLPLRLGRSSSCEISVPDPSLSRNHCLFELRDGSAWVTDLASANGTQLNGADLGADSVSLKPGDRLLAGDVELALVVEGAAPPPALETTESVASAVTSVDLGLGGEAQPAAENANRQPLRILLWSLAALVVVAVGAMILFSPSSGGEGSDAQTVVPVKMRPFELVSFTYEKVEASPRGIQRYALAFSRAGELAVEIDDVPAANRRVRKSVRLGADARKRLVALFEDRSLAALEREYAALAPVPGEFRTLRLHLVTGDRVQDVAVANAIEPESFRRLREKLEAFSKNELGIWAVQHSAEQLRAMSAESRGTADALWNERDVRHANCAAAVAGYRDAMLYLETVEPKPADYETLVASFRAAEAELRRRVDEQHFRAELAIKQRDWSKAGDELRILREMLPENDSRRGEVDAKLNDVEGRQQKGKR